MADIYTICEDVLISPYNYIVVTHCIGSAQDCWSYAQKNTMTSGHFMTIYKMVYSIGRYVKHVDYPVYMLQQEYIRRELEKGIVKGPIFFTKDLTGTKDNEFVIDQMSTKFFDTNKSLYITSDHGTHFKNLDVMIAIMSKDIKRLSNKSVLRMDMDVDLFKKLYEAL
jgi:hypothetical protein